MYIIYKYTPIDIDGLCIVVCTRIHTECVPIHTHSSTPRPLQLRAAAMFNFCWFWTRLSHISMDGFGRICRKPWDF